MGVWNSPSDSFIDCRGLRFHPGELEKLHPDNSDKSRAGRHVKDNPVKGFVSRGRNQAAIANVCVIWDSCSTSSVFALLRRDKGAASGENRETHGWLLGFVGCLFDGVFTGDIGYNNVHPPLIAFLNITKVPVLPAPAFGFGGSNR